MTPLDLNLLRKTLAPLAPPPPPQHERLPLPPLERPGLVVSSSRERARRGPRRPFRLHETSGQPPWAIRPLRRTPAVGPTARGLPCRLRSRPRGHRTAHPVACSSAPSTSVVASDAAPPARWRCPRRACGRRTTPATRTPGPFGRQPAAPRAAGGSLRIGGGGPPAPPPRRGRRSRLSLRGATRYALLLRLPPFVGRRREGDVVRLPVGRAPPWPGGTPTRSPPAPDRVPPPLLRRRAFPPGVRHPTSARGPRPTKQAAGGELFPCLAA